MSVIYGVLLLLTIPALIKLTSSPQEPVSSVRNNKNLIVTEQRVFDDADILSDSEEKALEKKAKELATQYSKMDAASAAQILSEMSEDLDLVCDILENMGESNAAAILQEMDTTYAAQITKKIAAVK